MSQITNMSNISCKLHSNNFLNTNENGAVLLRIRLSSTLQRTLKRSSSHSKTLTRVERFENDAFWKRCFLVWTVKTMLSENGDVIQIVTTRRQPTRPWVIQNGEQTVPCGFSLDDRCSVDGRKRYENDRCGRKSFWKQSKTAPFLFEKGISVDGALFQAPNLENK